MFRPRGPEERRADLVETLRGRGYLRSPAAVDAFLATPREAFLPRHVAHKAYRDTPLPIGGGQTISAPHMVAIMVEALDVRPGQRVLEVGTGSGYHAAILSRLVGPDGRIVSLDIDADLADRAGRRLAELGCTHVEVHAADGAQGWPDGAPYDRISVACAARTVPPALKAQLAEDGVLLLPVGEGPSRLLRLVRQGDRFPVEDLGPCAFVPLRGPSRAP